MAASGAEWPRHQLVLSVKDNNHAVPVPGVGPWDLRATQMTNVPRGVEQGRGGVRVGGKSRLPSAAFTPASELPLTAPVFPFQQFSVLCTGKKPGTHMLGLG